MFNKYPYTDFHELNADWLLQKVKKLETELHNYKIYNTLHYEGIWDITKNYQAYSIVEHDNIAYLCTQLTPSGIDITNTDYWVVIADYSQVFTGACYLTDKKVVIYGDSTVEKPYNGISYMDIVAHVAKCDITNRAKGGTRMAYGTDNGVSLINDAVDLADYDIMFLCYGTNEWQLGQLPNEIRYSVNNILDAAIAKNPNLEIIFVNPFYSRMNLTDHPYNYNGCGMTLDEVNKIIQNELYTRDIKYIDLYHTSACSPSNFKTYLDESGSLDIFVHPNLLLKANIATIIVKGAESETKMFTHEMMLKSYDFVLEQAVVTTSQYTGNTFGSNLCIIVAANTTAYSTPKVIDNNESGEYIIIGNTTQPITVSLAGKNVDVKPGRFKIKMKNLSSAFDKLAITTGNNAAVIGDLQMYHVTAYGTGSTGMFQFGRKKIFTANGVTFGVRKPGYHFTEVGIQIDAGGFTIPATIAADTTILTADSDVTFLQSFGTIVDSTSGDTYTVIYTGQEVKSLTSIPNGSYILIDKMLSFPLNENVNM